MKILVLSDIHSNIYALESIWDRERDSDRIYCTGDLVDYGPYPREVLNWVRDHDVICTQGNHDKWLVENYRSGQLLEHISPEERAWVHHNASLLGDEDIHFLSSLPVAITFQQDGVNYGMTHLYKEYEEIVSTHTYDEFCSQSFAEWENHPFSRLIFGHTHRQAIRYLSDDVLWLNPGSVSYRRRDDPDQSAHYATIVDGILSLKREPYNLNPLRRHIRGVALKDSEMRVVERFFRKR
jgi:putative phosphoesterase